MSAPRGSGRRPKDDSLSRDAVVRAAIELLDDAGTSGLTVRALASRLSTGPGSIYHHVGNQRALLDMACDRILSSNMPETSAPAPASAREALSAIRAIGIALFDTLDRHPWVGAHLPRSAGVPGLLRATDRIGGLLETTGTPPHQQFFTATAILNYVLGVAGQMTRNAHSVGDGVSRSDWLAERAQMWEQTDPDDYPFLRRMAADLRDHDDREQFTAGLDLILAGIAASPGPRN